MRPWHRHEIQVIGTGFRLVEKNQNCEERGKRTSQQDVCGWSSWHEVLTFMFIFGCIFLSPLMQISGLGSNPTGLAPKLQKVRQASNLGESRSLSFQAPVTPQIRVWVPVHQQAGKGLPV